MLGKRNAIKKERKKYSLQDQWLSGKAFLQKKGVKYRGAGFVVEATLLLPLFFITIMTMAGFMNIYKLQTVKLAEVCQTAKTMAMYISAETAEGDLTVPVMYSYKPLFSLFPLPGLYMGNAVTVKKWTGTTYPDCQGTEHEPMVYMTLSGKVYHKKDCSYLYPSVQAVGKEGIDLLRNQNGERYIKCANCRFYTEGQTVYVTMSGNHYHTTNQCVSLKHAVVMVRASEAKSLYRACSRCGG